MIDNCPPIGGQFFFHEVRAEHNFKNLHQGPPTAGLDVNFFTDKT